MTSVLMVLSATDHWTLNDGTKHPSGVWAEEFAVPYETSHKLASQLVADLSQTTRS